MVMVQGIKGDLPEKEKVRRTRIFRQLGTDGPPPKIIGVEEQDVQHPRDQNPAFQAKPALVSIQFE